MNAFTRRCAFLRSWGQLYKILSFVTANSFGERDPCRQRTHYCFPYGTFALSATPCFWRKNKNYPPYMGGCMPKISGPTAVVVTLPPGCRQQSCSERLVSNFWCEIFHKSCCRCCCSRRRVRCGRPHRSMHRLAPWLRCHLSAAVQRSALSRHKLLLCQQHDVVAATAGAVLSDEM